MSSCKIHGVCKVMEEDGMDLDERREVLNHIWCIIVPFMNVQPEDIRGIHSEPYFAYI